MADRLKADDLASPDWLLAGFEFERGLYHFGRVSRSTYSESAFLDHRIRPVPAQVGTADGQAVDEFIRQLNGAQVTWVLHTAFCASTLLAGCLDWPGRSLVAREPLVLSRLAQLKRDLSAERGEIPPGADWDAHQRRVLALSERGYGRERVIVKPSNFANALIPELAGRDGAHRRFVLMSSSLVELMVSVLKKQDEALKLMPGFLASLLRDSDYRVRVGEPALEGLDLLQQSFVFWHCQRYQLQRFLEDFPASTIHPLTLQQFFQDPDTVLQEISRFAGLELSAEEVRGVVKEKVNSSHSKHQGVAYSPARHQEESADLLRRYRPEIESALEWAAPLLERAPPRRLGAERDAIGLAD